MSAWRTWLCLLLAALPLSGCGAAGIAIIIVAASSGGGSSGGGGGGSDTDRAVENVSLPAAPFQSDAVSIDYDVIDKRNRPVDVIVRYSLDGGATFPFQPTPGTGSEPTQGLSSSPSGVTHLFVWDSAADLTESRVSDVRFRFTPLDDNGNPLSSDAGESPTFEVDNSQAPRVLIVSVTGPGGGSSVNGDATIEIDVEDEEEDDVDVELRYSTDGGQSFTLLDGISGPTTGLTSGPLGAPMRYAIPWDTTLDVPGVASVILEAVGTDTKAGPSGFFGPLDVNNATHSVVLDGIDPPAGFDVFELRYTLFDDNSDPANVAVFWSDDGTTPSQAATRARGRDGEGTSGLTTSPAGEAHTFLWDASLDVGVGVVASDLRVEVHAIKVSTGAEVVSGVAGPVMFDGRLVATVAGAAGGERIVPGALAADPDGTLVFVDAGGAMGLRIRRLDLSSGTVTEVAGGGMDPGENVPGDQALIQPTALAVDPGGDVYFIDGDRIRRVIGLAAGTPTVETFAGGGTQTGDGVARLLALLQPRGLSTDALGDIYFTDGAAGERVRRIVSATELVDSVTLTDPMGMPVVPAELADIVADDQGNLYFSDPGSHRVWFFDNVSISNRTFVLAGTGSGGFSGDGGLATLAELDTPRELTLDRTGRLFVHDAQNQRIRAVSGGLIDSVVGGGLAAAPDVEGLDLEVLVRGLSSQGVANLYVAHSADTLARISRRSGSSPLLEMVLGEGGPSLAGGELFVEDFGMLTDTLAIDDRTMLVVEAERFVRMVDRLSGTVQNVVGNGSLLASGDGGAANQAGANPVAITLDASGTVLFLADRINDRIRRVDLVTGLIETPALFFDPTSFPPPLDTLSSPSDVELGIGGLLYVADSGNHRVLRIDTATWAVENFAGTGTAGDSGDGGAATSAQLNTPRGIFLDSVGNVFVLDQGRRLDNAMRVRRVLIVSGQIQTVAGGGALDPDMVPATQAALNNITDGIAVGGDLWLTSFRADLVNDLDPALVIRVNLGSGLTSIDAGVLDPASGVEMDGIPARMLRIVGAWGVTRDSNGTLYFSEPARGTVRRFVSLP